MARLTTVAPALAIVFALTACTSPPPGPVETPAQVAPSPAPEPVSPAAVEVARGTLVSPDGSTSGIVSVTFDGKGYFARIDDYETTFGGELNLAFTDERLAPGDCAYNRYQLAFSLTDSWPEGGMDLQLADPMIFDSVVVVKYPSGPVVPGVCWEEGVAWADLNWAPSE